MSNNQMIQMICRDMNRDEEEGSYETRAAIFTLLLALNQQVASRGLEIIAELRVERVDVLVFNKKLKVNQCVWQFRFTGEEHEMLPVRKFIANILGWPPERQPAKI